MFIIVYKFASAVKAHYNLIDLSKKSVLWLWFRIYKDTAHITKYHDSVGLQFFL